MVTTDEWIAARFGSYSTVDPTRRAAMSHCLGDLGNLHPDLSGWTQQYLWRARE